MPEASSPILVAEQPLRVRLTCADGQVQRVDAAWQRLPVEQLWLGQPASAIEPALRRTLTICLQAHLGAAQQAVRAARHGQSPTAVQPASEAAIGLEAARDTLRRWLLDYPRAFGGVWPANAVPAWKGISDVATLAAYCRAHIFGMAAQDWLALDHAGLNAWIEAQATVPALWLGSGLAAPLRRHALPLAADLLEWAGAHAGQLLDGGAPAPAPPHAHPDVASNGRDLPSALLLHRLGRLARTCLGAVARPQGGFSCADIGIGWAHSARGLLLHLARIGRDRVTAYRIVPPTLWNAAPDGIMARALTGLSATEAARCAEQLLLLLDPCAPFEITLNAPPTQGDGKVNQSGSAAHA